MKKFIISFVLLIIILSFTSCRSYKPPIKYDFDKSAIINKSFDDVWTLLIRWFGENNTPIKTIEKQSGFISTEFNLSAENIKYAMDCGKLPITNHFVEHAGNFNVIVEKINDTITKVTINAFFHCYSGRPTRNNKHIIEGDRISCNSTGYMEKTIFEYLKQ
jgi:uncharacterized alpha/beta hydrolase family protein